MGGEMMRGEKMEEEEAVYSYIILMKNNKVK